MSVGKLAQNKTDPLCAPQTRWRVTRRKLVTNASAQVSRAFTVARISMHFDLSTLILFEEMLLHVHMYTSLDALKIM